MIVRGDKITPYFEAPSTDIPPSRRMLLIGYNFPPDRLVGGLRWQEMSRHFAAQGWAVDVIARDFSQLPDLDFARLHQLAPGTRVFSVPDAEPLIGRMHRVALAALKRSPGRIQRRSADTKRNASAPSRRALASLRKAYLVLLSIRRSERWARAAASMAIGLAKNTRYSTVISSGPPHMAHQAGRMVAQATGLPLVVDMRDPWSLVERVPEEFDSPLWFIMARRHERKVVRRAALITMNTEKACEAMRKAYPELSQRIEVVCNGSDDSSLPGMQRDGVFRIRFAGSIYLDRDPRLLFRAAACVIHDLGLTPDRFAIEFVGDSDPHARKPAAEIAAEEGMEQFLRMGGVLQRQETLEFLASATMLLSLPQDSNFAIPAKIYEYVKMDAWMLVLAHPDSATALLLDGTEAAVIDPADVDGMATEIRRRVQQFLRGEMPTAVGKDGRFDRRVQSDKLMRLVEAFSELAV